MSIEIEEKKLEKKRVLLSADEKRLLILKRKREIERLETGIQEQEQRAKELDAQIMEMGGE